MRPYRVIVAVCCIVCSAEAVAQVVSVDCCMTADDLRTIGLCLSGPQDLQTPTGCYPVGTCVLGFGSDTAMMTALCDADRPEIPDMPRAICSSWGLPGAQVSERCVAGGADGVTLFSMFNVGGDGDFDLRDLASFLENYQTVPNQVPSAAGIASVTCCYPEAGVTAVGRCLMGPGVAFSQEDCGFQLACEIGFTAAVDAGDYLFRMCSADAVNLPQPTESFCTSWVQPGAEAVQSCRANPTDGIASIIALDEDEDGDLDLADFAVFQTKFDAP